MASKPEEVLNHPVNRKKPLSLSSRFEPSHLAFSLSGRLMRDLSPIVGMAFRVVGHPRFMQYSFYPEIPSLVLVQFLVPKRVLDFGRRGPVG